MPSRPAVAPAVVVLALVLGPRFAAVGVAHAAVDSFLPAWHGITGAEIGRHVEVLASDAYGGREPGTAGEDSALAYLERAFAAAGAGPWSAAEGYRQAVPLVEVTATGTARLTVRDARGRWTPEPGREFVARFGRPLESVELADVPLVFAGFGVTAPEYGWDDYGGARVDGAAVLYLRGEPGDPADSTTFLGRAITTHALPQNKSRNAARHGARLAVVVHTDSSAGHPWSTIGGGGLGRTQMFLAEDVGGDALDGSVHLSEPVVRALLARAGHDLDALVARARRPGFRPVPLGTRLSLSNRGRTRSFTSHNVIARIEGREAPDECVLYTAHWDHVGTNPSLSGDRIFNGAVDNATGTAGLLELARAFASLPERPRRSVLFVATTCEEKGLLGSEHLSRHPVVPLRNTVAVINLDALFPFGSFRGMAVPGFGASEIEDVLAVAARRVDRVLLPDDQPQAGAYYRSDHWPFAEKGVPAVFAVGNPRAEDFARDSVVTKRFTDYMVAGYHKPGDEYDAATWDLRGVEEDVRVLFETGWRLADDHRFPNWYWGNPFRAKRDAMRDPGAAPGGASGGAAP
jgi:hypothetical protein